MLCKAPHKKTPVILDTDIGTDIDDTWALAMMLNSPELDIKLVITDHGDTHTRARIAAKLLERAGRTDIPVAVGVPGGGATHSRWGELRISQRPWVDDYPLSRYPGTVYEDGVTALIDTILRSDEPVTVVAIGPITNLGEALRRQPLIAQKARFVGMHGSVYTGHVGHDAPEAEYNVIMDIPACQRVFTAAWDITITPLDSCGRVRLTGEKHRAVTQCKTPLIQALMENYRIWHAANRPGEPADGWQHASTTLYDTVAIYLAFCEDLLHMQELGIRVTDEGCTVEDEGAKRIRCATAWKDLPAFEDLLVQRLLA